MQAEGWALNCALAVVASIVDVWNGNFRPLIQIERVLKVNGTQHISLETVEVSSFPTLHKCHVPVTSLSATACDTSLVGVPGHSGSHTSCRSTPASGRRTRRGDATICRLPPTGTKPPLFVCLHYPPRHRLMVLSLFLYSRSASATCVLLTVRDDRCSTKRLDI